MANRQSSVERFWSRVDRQGPGECWPWLASRFKDGYGQFRLGSHSRAHRISWTLTFGDIPPGLCVLHRCDNPACCNPAHLFLGTNLDNVADMIAKGRNATGDRNGSRLHPERLLRGDRHPNRLRPERVPRGVKNKNSKLTESDIRAIRNAVASGESQASVALKFGVHQTCVSAVVRLLTWRHIT